MRRRLLIVAVFLLAGAVVNVAVAWGCVIWSKPPTIVPGPFPVVEPWPAAVPSEWPSPPYLLTTRTSVGVTDLTGFSPDLELKYLQWSLRAGLPFRSLYLVRNRTEDVNTQFSGGTALTEFVLPILERPDRLMEGI